MVRRALLVLLLSLGAAGAGSSAVFAAGVPTTGVAQASVALRAAHTFRLASGTTHVALHWRSRAGVRVRYALSRDGIHFGRARVVLMDETGEGRRGETYGALVVAAGVRAVRVQSSRSLLRLTLVELADRGPRLARLPLRLTAGVYAQPTVTPRSGWGADESLRFDASGKEVWPPAFYPVQKVVVHHTATQNADPDPAATIRSIYYYHAITQAWGDIGYNFLIDESGRIYEGRYSRAYAAGVSPTGQDLNGNGVTAAHAYGYNSGTVGIALLGTLTNQDATPAARGALERLIAWIDGSHGIDPQAASLYTNPVSGAQATFPNIAGHRDVGATECPGGTLYATLPTIRSDVAALLGSTAPDFALAISPSSANADPGSSASYTVSVSVVNGFSGSVSLTITGLPPGAAAAFTSSTLGAPGSSQLVVSTATSTPPGSYQLTISGTSGSTTRTTSATLVVNPPPDFGLAISPGSRSVKRGSSTTYTVSVSSQGGFNGSVSLAVSGLPTGTSASFTPVRVGAPGSATLTITTSSSAPRGTFVFTVTGSGPAGLTHSASVTLAIK